jgi:hypothetical protein
MVARAAGFTAARQVRGQAGTFMAGNEMSRPGGRLKRKNRPSPAGRRDATIKGDQSDWPQKHEEF